MPGKSDPPALVSRGQRSRARTLVVVGCLWLIAGCAHPAGTVQLQNDRKKEAVGREATMASLPIANLHLPGVKLVSSASYLGQKDTGVFESNGQDVEVDTKYASNVDAATTCGQVQALLAPQAWVAVGGCGPFNGGPELALAFRSRCGAYVVEGRAYFYGRPIVATGSITYNTEVILVTPYPGDDPVPGMSAAANFHSGNACDRRITSATPGP